MNANFWDKRSKQYDDAIKKHDALYDNTIESTKALLGRSDVVLDLGCASGEIGLDIAPHVQRVHGIDTSAKMIELANEKACKRCIDNAIFDEMDPYDRSLSTHSFSAVIALSIFHLVDDTSKVLDRLNDLLAPGGLLISETPCLREKSRFFRLLINLAQKFGLAPRIFSFSISELESLVARGGFDIRESKLRNEKNAIQWIVARKRQSTSELGR